MYKRDGFWVPGQPDLRGGALPFPAGFGVAAATRLCRADRHYYDAGPRAPQPIYMKVPHVPYTMSVYLAEVAELFRGHEVLRDYAASLGARIVNRTRGSMIDAYERGAE